MHLVTEGNSKCLVCVSPAPYTMVTTGGVPQALRALLLCSPGRVRTCCIPHCPVSLLKCMRWNPYTLPGTGTEADPGTVSPHQETPPPHRSRAWWTQLDLVYFSTCWIARICLAVIHRPQIHNPTLSSCYICCGTYNRCYSSVKKVKQLRLPKLGLGGGEAEPNQALQPAAPRLRELALDAPTHMVQSHITA